MSNYADMPLDTILQVGDLVTVTGPGEHDVLVREVTSTSSKGAVMSGMTALDATLRVVLEGEGRILSRVQRPGPALPTVEGDYILTVQFGARYVRSLTNGSWLDASGHVVSESVLREHVSSGSATLTRVIPADEVKHPEVDMVKALEAFEAANKSSFNDDFVATLRRVLEGEFDL